MKAPSDGQVSNLADFSRGLRISIVSPPSADFSSVSARLQICKRRLRYEQRIKTSLKFKTK